MQLKNEISKIQRFTLMLIVGAALLSFLIKQPVVAQSPEISPSRVQIVTGTLELHQTIRFALDGLRTGDVLYVYAEGTSANLDTFIAVVASDLTLADIERETSIALAAAASNGAEPVAAIAVLNDNLFLANDDDGGTGYDAALTFTIPSDGGYALILRSSYANPSFGNYRLRVGVNAPEVLTGTGESTDNALLVIDETAPALGAAVQEFTDTLSVDTGVDVYHLEPLSAGDVLYVYIEIMEGDLRPIVVLQDFGGKFAYIVETADEAKTIAFEYTFPERAVGYKLTLVPPGLNTLETANYRLLLGVNTPEVLSGVVEVTQRRLVDAPTEVQIGLEIDEISNVNQQGENYSIVASLDMRWQDSKRAFRSDVCGCDQKTFIGNGFLGFTNFSGETTWPDYLLFNQQGRRETQNRGAVVQPDGTTTYTERFTVTLQAPDFDFRLFPFDSQDFYVRIQMILDDNRYVLVPNTDRIRLGNQLGEEQWLFRLSDVAVTSEDGISRLTVHLEANRHQTYYLFRLFLPIVLITVVTWVTFFLGDYVKRIDVAGANLLVFVAFNFTVSSDLPRLGYLTLLDTVLISTFVVTILIIVLNVYLQWLRKHDREERARRIDQIAIWAYPVGFFALTAALILFFVIATS
jgi:hypothetical protein